MTTPLPERYTISVTREQAAHLQHALEVVARISMGQFDMALDCCCDSKGEAINGWEVRDAVESVVKPLMGLSKNAYRGVGRNRPTDLRWEMSCAIRQQLAWDHAFADGLIRPGEPRDWMTMMGRSYDDPMKYTDSPLLKIQAETPPDDLLDFGHPDMNGPKSSSEPDAPLWGSTSYNQETMQP